MSTSEYNVVKSFLACDSEQEARKITETCDNPFVISALADINGSFLSISKNTAQVFGCSQQELMDRHETVFSMTYDEEKPQLFKAYSSALLEGSVFRLMQHIYCHNYGPTPVVTHLKKITGENNKDLVLCLNIRA